MASNSAFCSVSSVEDCCDAKIAEAQQSTQQLLLTWMYVRTMSGFWVALICASRCAVSLFSSGSATIVATVPRQAVARFLTAGLSLASCAVTQLDLHCGVLRNPTEQAGRQPLGHAGPHGLWHVCDERLQADGVDVAQLSLALQDEAAQLVADLSDLGLLHLLQQDAQALDSNALHVVAGVVELQQHCLADAALKGGVELHILAQLSAQITRGHVALILVPVFSLL
eukprot:16334-Heterococcus_DN1.PRE.1